MISLKLGLVITCFQSLLQKYLHQSGKCPHLTNEIYVDLSKSIYMPFTSIFYHSEQFVALFGGYFSGELFLEVAVSAI